MIMAFIDLLNTQQGITDAIAATGSAVQTARLTPINAVAASFTVLATEVAQMSNGDTITFAGETFTKASSTDAEAGEFADVAGVRSCIDGLLDGSWTASGSTNATASSDIKGLAYNGEDAVYSILEATTAGGGVSAKSTATIAAAMLAVMANGDEVTFAGSTFAKGAGVGEFENATELAALIGAITGWDAAEDTGAVVITAAENGAANDGEEAVITLNRTTSGGVNGTVGLKDQIVADATYLYVCTAANSVNGANWRRISVGSVY